MGSLKEVIKEKNFQTLSTVVADDVTLYRAEIDDEETFMHEIKRLSENLR